MPTQVRSTMMDLIAKTRLLISDPSGATEVFADAEIQDALDNRRRDVYLERLTEQPTVAGPPTGQTTGGGAVSWLDYYSDGGWWETDAFIQSYTYQILTPTSTPVAVASFDPIVGHWHLSANQWPPVVVTGKQYDLYAAAADLCEAWVAKLALSYDFLSAGRTFKRSQMVKHLSDLATFYRNRQKLWTSSQVRTDMTTAREDLYR